MVNKVTFTKKINHRRSPLLHHPLLRKGGIHQKNNKAKRRQSKMQIKKEWIPQNIFEIVCFGDFIRGK